jgi:hypothetical protein
MGGTCAELLGSARCPFRATAPSRLPTRHPSALPEAASPKMPRIFDNIATDLLPALRDTLQISQRADFCVGYFNLRGWKAIDGLIEQWAGGDGAQCRLLVGMQRLAQDELRLAYSLLPHEDQISQQAVIRLKRRLAEEFRAQLTFGAPADDDEKRSVWLSHYSNRPGQLFTGAQNRLTILITSGKKDEPKQFSTRYHKWDARNGERDNLFPVTPNTTHWRKSGLLIDSIDSKPCKPIIDEIDTVLAGHYGFTPEELDYILNYDIKFRLGRDAEGQEE